MKRTGKIQAISIVIPMSEKDKLNFFKRLDELEEQVAALTWELARLRYKETAHQTDERPEFLDAKEVNFTAKFYNEPWTHVQFVEKEEEKEEENEDEDGS